MGRIYFSDLLFMAEGTVQALSPTGEFQEVHLRQGSLDGACGPYCLFMALLAAGVIDRADAMSLMRPKRNTRFGKLISAIEEHTGLFREGTNIYELETIIRESYGKVVGIAANDGRGTKIRDFVVEHIGQGHVVLFGVNFPDGAHWLLGIGFEFETGQEEDEIPARLLAIDPDSDPPNVAAWNSILETTPQKGSYPYYWWTEGFNVRFEDAIAIWPLKK